MQEYLNWILRKYFLILNIKDNLFIVEYSTKEYGKNSIT